ncbi:hypothetical protein MROS_2801 [Melioribacter roseus P3M-2]|uniref:Uncharacterized protein n=1 Tax=Melioribacter roseus (strain DSM 23840 / JCM 17771 / VKM B-2668 / P3M-2) TaxID=1191523 RepID=I7A835_MELRP|nr:hypothetical protein MROS_2801 [Melioribacter roseus P3M-2]
MDFIKTSLFEYVHTGKIISLFSFIPKIDTLILLSKQNQFQSFLLPNAIFLIIIDL